MFAFWQTNVKVDVIVLAEILAQDRAQRSSINASRNFPGKIAPCQRVVPRAVSWCPHWGKLSYRRSACWRIKPKTRIDRLHKANKSSLMRQNLRNRDGIFSVGGKFRPDLRDGRLISIIQLANNRRDHQRSYTLGRGIDRHKRLIIPDNRLFAVGISAGQIDNDLTVHDRAETRTELGFIGKVGLKGIPDRLKARFYKAAYRCHVTSRDLASTLPDRNAASGIERSAI